MTPPTATPATAPTQATVVDRIDRVASDVVALTLRGTEGPPAAWEPGAHVDLRLPNWLTRQYSLCGDPADRDTYRVAVRHDRLSRGGSEYVHRFLRPGRPLPVSPPRNHFPLLPAPRYLFVAGGIGITPVLPMLRARGPRGRAGRPAVRGAVARRDALRRRTARRVRDRGAGRRHPAGGQARPGRPGTRLDEDTLVYCCGPAPLLAAAAGAFPAQRLYTERFRPSARTFGPEAVCRGSGRTVPVAAGESMLDALAHAGHPLPAGCREGVCGSCELAVARGEIEHRDDIGAPAGRMYPCVSRARSPRLVVDL